MKEITDKVNIFSSEDKSNPTLYIASRDDLIETINDRDLRYPLVYCDEKLFTEEIDGKKKKFWGINFRVLRNIEQGSEEWDKFLDVMSNEILQVMKEEWDLSGVRISYDWYPDDKPRTYMVGILNGGKTDMLV